MAILQNNRDYVWWQKSWDYLFVLDDFYLALAFYYSQLIWLIDAIFQHFTAARSKTSNDLNKFKSFCCLLLKLVIKVTSIKFLLVHNAPLLSRSDMSKINSSLFSSNIYQKVRMKKLWRNYIKSTSKHKRYVTLHDVI